MPEPHLIDLRSDTITRPTPAMRQAMAAAEVGDDVWGDDPTVKRLESLAAERLGHEAAVFCPSGTQTNLIALLTHCGRGDEYIVGSEAHTYKWEGGGAAVLGGIQPQTVPFDANGGISLDDVAQVIKPDDVHYARSRLLCLENTQHGRVQSLQSMQAARSFVDEKGLSLHLDGARVANAAVALDVSLESIGHCFHSVSLCLSKGLGAPVGSVLVGGQGFIKEARRWRKVTGGGMRQAGVLAAAGLLALTEGFDRLHEDHANAELLARLLVDTPGLRVRDGWTQTNMVWLDLDEDQGVALADHAREHGVLLAAEGYGARLVTHRDVSTQDIEQAARVIGGFFSR